MVTRTDPLYSQQWHLSMLGNIRKIWQDYTGAGVHVAVYDDGVQATHTDLAANYDASRHFIHSGTSHDPSPNSDSDAHGTACAGLIAAAYNNGLGGAGVAHGATITGIDYLNDLQKEYDPETQAPNAIYHAAMRWASKFDIMSNSWGSTPDFSELLNPNIAGSSAAVDAGHFAWVSANGRGGLGTIVVKAAGNESANANGDGENVSRHTITVAATTQDGFAASYSNFGSSILVTAPAASVTTDLMGKAGYNRTGTAEGNPDYALDFNGTSAATPVVSGVVALMLDANAGLGWRDVQSILALSAGHTGSALDSDPSETEVGQWATMEGNTWNGGGAIYHMSYGFGMVDAYAATRMAEVWTRLYGAAHTTANEAHVVSRSGTVLAMRDSDGSATTPEGQISFSVSQDIEIDSVQVKFSIKHAQANEVVAYLQSPSGQKILLYTGDAGVDAFDNGLTWTFAAEALRGMSSQGTWELMFLDLENGDTGTVSNARLDFYGSTSSANDVYHFTDDFRMLRDLQADRRVIDDTNGGIDWLNFAGMSGRLSVNMRAGGNITVDGVNLASFGGSTADFERLQAGDGADYLVGNGLSNRIFGGRGNDRIFGAAGNDILVGERGNDVLAGGSGVDSFVFRRGCGHDRITDWVDNEDTLKLDDAIWKGGKTIAQVVSDYGSVASGAAVLTFGSTLSITIAGVSNLASLLDDITII